MLSSICIKVSMPSLKAKIIQGIIRNRNVLKGQFKNTEFSHSKEAVLEFRSDCEKGGERFGKLPKNVTVNTVNVDRVYAEFIVPNGAPKDKLIFYVHGGGYVSGSCNDHRAIVSKVCVKTGLSCILYEYGLAPEKPFPAAINDSIEVWNALPELGYNYENVVIMGESAGGGLALSLLFALKDKGLPMPKATVAISPWADLNCTNNAYSTRNRKSLAPLNSWNVFSDYYVGDADPNHPYISPLFGDSLGLPPIFINAGDADELYDDAYLFYQKAKANNVDVYFRQGEGLVHCYPLLAPMFSEATNALDEISDFVKRQLQCKDVG